MNKAAEIFSVIYSNVFDNHAAIKVFQNRKNYAPWLSDETKELIKKRNELKARSRVSSDPHQLYQYRRLRNTIRNRLKYEKINYYKYNHINMRILEQNKYGRRPTNILAR